MTQDIEGAHRHSIHHRGEIEASTLCGCFYCCAIFPPAQITKWADDDDTALCPDCAIDSVIGDRSGYPITHTFLEAMKRHWF